MKICQWMLMCLVVADLAALPPPAKGQSLSGSGGTPDPVATTTPGRQDLLYTPPTETTKLHNYAFETFGPFPAGVAAFAAGIDQIDNSPPEWRQGAEGYGKRFGSEFGREAVGTTTRFALAAAFREDTLYYRCDCRGFLPRVSHALVSTLTGRRGEDGHRVFSFAALAAPYVGSTAAVYGWYPSRFGIKDALRMGNYSLLEYAGGNLALEFFYTAPRSMIARMRMNNRHAAP